MARYQVKLFRNILSSDGHPFRCLQSTTEVEADGPDSAVSRVIKGKRGAAQGVEWSLLEIRKPCPDERPARQ